MLSPDDLSPERQSRYRWFARWALLLAGLIHVLFILISLKLDAHDYAIYSLLSAMLYPLIYRFAASGRFLLTITAVWCLLIVHEAVSTYFFSWTAGFALYLVLLPQVLFMYEGISLRTRLISLCVLIVFVVWRASVSIGQPGAVTLSANAIHLLYLLNFTLTLIAASSLSLLVFSAVRKMERALSTLAATDALTGLRNRRSFIDSMDELIRASTRRQDSFSIGVLDIDHFKQINDIHGHDVGDEILRLCARILRDNLKAGDMAFRWGGEEFVILFREASLETARLAADRLRKLMQSASDHTQLPRFTVTIGLAEWHSGESKEQLFQRADQALYSGKQAGRDRTVSVSIEQAVVMSA